MAWIEAHQELARHPKLRRLARDLGVSRAEAIGHLFMLWWWAVDYASDGIVTDAEDIADAADWEPAEAEWFTKTLASVGFLDELDTGWAIHDWSDYAGKAADVREARRRDGSYGNHVRWHQKRPNPHCEWCSLGDIGGRSGGDRGGESHITRHDIRRNARTSENVENPTAKPPDVDNREAAVRVAQAWTEHPTDEDVAGAATAIDAHPWLADLTATDLAKVVTAAQKAGTRFPSGLASPRTLEYRPPKPPPPWCGHCDETSRMVDHGTAGFARCPTCHPKEHP